LCPCAFGLNPSLPINQYAHKAWTIRDGFFKSTVLSIAQTPDGYLSLGTDSGLVRFDGVRIVEWQPPAGEHLPSSLIRSLLAGRDIHSLYEDGEGTVWAAGLPGAKTVPVAGEVIWTEVCALKTGRQPEAADTRIR
jgi:ligand-binding sensor domain-containing protein